METIEKLNALKSYTPSEWREKAHWRRENREWLKKSREIALAVLNAISNNPAMTQKELARQMGVSPQYVSKILKGEENLSLQTITKLESILEIELISVHKQVQQFESKQVLSLSSFSKYKCEDWRELSFPQISFSFTLSNQFQYN